MLKGLNAQNECPNFVCTVEHTDINTFLLAEFRNNLIQTLNETERGVAVAPTHGIELEELN